VSLLLEWRRRARHASRTVRYVNLPANLKSLAELYGVTELLGEM
jgi:phospholipid transport system transporter-binding protein